MDRAFYMLALLTTAAACVSHPEPDVQTQQTSAATLAAGEIVTVLSATRTSARTEFATCVHEAMLETAPNLALMPGHEFRDALYPWFEPATLPADVEELSMLISKPAVKRRIEELAVRYVVVIAGNTDRQNEGSFTCVATYSGAGCLGFSSEERTSRLSAALWDVEQGASAGEVTAKTAGTRVSIGVIVPILFFSATESAACDGLGERLAQLLTGKAPVTTKPGDVVPNAVYVD